MFFASRNLCPFLFLKMNMSDNVIRKAFINLEHFLQKVAALDIFEVLIFNYKIKIGLLDPLAINFLALISELCDEFNTILKDGNHEKSKAEPVLVSDTDNSNSDSTGTKVEEPSQDIPIVLSLCDDDIDHKSEFVEIPILKDIESKECIQNHESSDSVKAVIITSENQDSECSSQRNNEFSKVSKSLDDAQTKTETEVRSENDFENIHCELENNVCKFCCRKFISCSKLIGHLTKCSKVKTKNANEECSHKCNECDLIFPSLKLLSGHISQNHSKSETNEDTAKDPMLYRVVEVQSLPENLPFYCCKSCLYVYKTPLEFEAHSCKEVSDKTETEGYVGDYFCMLGKYVVSNPDLLARMRKFRCGTCCEEYRSLSRMLYHLVRCTQGPYSCELCHLECASKRELNYHKKKAHRGTNSFFCDECGLAFKLRPSLQKHKVNRHERQADATCEQCNLTFSKRVQLTNHMIREHQVERKFLCQVCGNKFSTHSSLMAHLSTHSETYKFSCSFCNKKFKQKEKLIFHTRIHTGERPHLCPTCGKGFIRKSKLDDHMRRHRGEKQYHCSMCSKCYVSSWDLKLHMKKQHAEEMPTANVNSAVLYVSENVVSETEADDPREVNAVNSALNILSSEEAVELQELSEEAALGPLRELPVDQSDPEAAGTGALAAEALATSDGKVVLQLEPSPVPVANTLLQPAADALGPRLLLQLAQNGDASSRILVQLDSTQVAPGSQATLVPSTILAVADTLQLTPVVDDVNLNLGAVTAQYLQLAPAPGSAGGTDPAAPTSAASAALPLHIQLPVSAVPVSATAISQTPSNGTNPFGLQPVSVQAVFTPAGFNVNGISY